MGGQTFSVLLAVAVALSTMTLFDNGKFPMQAFTPVAVHSSTPSLALPMAQPGSDAQTVKRDAHVFIPAAERAEVYSPNTSQELIEILKESNLWDVGESLEIPPVVVARFPADLAGVTTEEKTRAFVHSLLPLVMIALDEVKLERTRLLLILNELGGQADDIYFSKGKSVWQEALSQENLQFILQLTKKYKTNSAAELLQRIDVLPASLVIAQAAIESSWGSSRFAKEANNIFGMWTWGKKGIIPARREAGKTHKIALYDSVLDSVRAYVLTLNRVSAYENLREIRSQTQDPMRISEGLLRYSERGEFYIADVKRVIERYNLKGYDKYRLALSAG